MEGDSSRASELEVQEHVSRYYESVRYSLPWSRQYHDWLFTRMIERLQPVGRILDAGCGNGWLGRYLPKENLWGIDIAPSMVALAAARLGDARVGDIEELPYEDNFFDTVFARSVIHHLARPDRGVAELNRVLRPGGRIVFLDTHDTILSHLPRKRMQAGEHFSELHRNMNRKAYRRLIEQFFTITSWEYVGFVAYAILGFPDVFNAYRFVPGKRLLTPLLIRLDAITSEIPLVNRLSLGILATCEKKVSCQTARTDISLSDIRPLP